jgi:hypothetical protein
MMTKPDEQDDIIEWLSVRGEMDTGTGIFWINHVEVEGDDGNRAP